MSSKAGRKVARVDDPSILNELVGRWSGTAQTWFEPGAPEVKAPISGTFRAALGRKSVIHEYRTRVDGKPASGIALIGRDLATQRFSIAWVDTFHTGTEIMVFHADDRDTERGFSVLGRYAFPQANQVWGWRTAHRLRGANALEIEHHNITPDGDESLAIRIVYERVRARAGTRRASR
jgi:hypothetical protein